MKDNIKKIESERASIIGFGNFGKLIAKHLCKTMNVVVTDVMDKRIEANEIGIKFVSLKEACRSKIIILSVPMENLEETLHDIKDHLHEGNIVIDVCSLKIFSCKLMDHILPINVEIIGTHPLFGPQSAPNSIHGMRIALINVRAKKETFENINNFCINLGLKTIITSPEEHDKQMAISQALTHFIGKVCKRANIQRVELSTKTFDDLMNIVEIVGNDTSKLFNNMQIMNPFAKQAREDFSREAVKLQIELDPRRSPYRNN